MFTGRTTTRSLVTCVLPSTFLAHSTCVRRSAHVLCTKTLACASRRFSPICCVCAGSKPRHNFQTPWGKIIDAHGMCYPFAGAGTSAGLALDLFKFDCVIHLRCYHTLVPFASGYCDTCYQRCWRILKIMYYARPCVIGSFGSCVLHRCCTSTCAAVRFSFHTNVTMMCYVFVPFVHWVSAMFMAVLIKMCHCPRFCVSPSKCDPGCSPA